MRKILDSRASPRAARPRDSSFQETDIFPTTERNKSLEGIGDLLRPKEQAANLFLAAAHEVRAADPRYTPSSHSLTRPHGRRLIRRMQQQRGQKRRGQRENEVRTPLLNARQLYASL